MGTGCAKAFALWPHHVEPIHLRGPGRGRGAPPFDRPWSLWIGTQLGRDGALGLQDLKEAGFQTYAQDAASCVVYGMPKAAMELGAAIDEGDPVSLGRKIANLPLKTTTRVQERTT